MSPLRHAHRTLREWRDLALGTVLLTHDSVAAHPLRSILAVLGIVIGIVTVIEVHKRLTDAVHRYGAKIFPQISHPGPESLAPFYVNMEAVGPSINRSESTGQLCRELKDEELPALVEMYGEAARRARGAGCDGVEVHMAHN